MNDTEKRAFSRITTHQTISIVPLDEYEKDGLWATLTSVDISETGILFESASAYAVGEQYMIRFSDKNNKKYDQKIEIIRVEEIITLTQYNIGAVFVNALPDLLQKLT